MRVFSTRFLFLFLLVLSAAVVASADGVSFSGGSVGCILSGAVCLKDWRINE
jgi:hypothetical protein